MATSYNLRDYLEITAGALAVLLAEGSLAAVVLWAIFK